MQTYRSVHTTAAAIAATTTITITAFSFNWPIFTQMTESKFRTSSGLFQHNKNKKTPSTHLAKLQAPELF